MVDQNGRPKIKFEYKLGWNSVLGEEFWCSNITVFSQ